MGISVATRIAAALFSLLIASAGLAAGQSNPRIAQRDVLAITVVGVQQFSGKFTVGVDGAIEFPQLGRVNAAGLTARELSDVIVKRLKDADILRSPQVAIELEQVPTRKVTVNGSVRSQGVLTFAGELTLLEAIVRAGGRLPDAADTALVVRASSLQDAASGTGKSPNPAMVEVNLRDLESGNLSKNIVLYDGDAIFVRKAQAVTITGFVTNVGAYNVEAGSNVEQALALAGGITALGSDRRIDITRIVDGKTVTLKGVKKTDIVKAGDIIRVGKKRV